MLTKNEIKEIGRVTGLKPHQQEKHYIQSLILQSLYSLLPDQLVFKGGTALFFCFGLNRFSEDLDFTMRAPLEIDNLFDRIQKDLILRGVSNTIGKIIETDVSISCKIRAEGPLYSKEIERCFVSIEISKRNDLIFYDVREVQTIYPDILPFTLPVMRKEEILAEKVRTIITRNYARDVFDLFFLTSHGTKIDKELIQKKLLFYNKKWSKKEFIQKLNDKEQLWNPELQPFIIGKLPSFTKVKKNIEGVFLDKV